MLCFALKAAWVSLGCCFSARRFLLNVYKQLEWCITNDIPTVVYAPLLQRSVHPYSWETSKIMGLSEDLTPDADFSSYVWRDNAWGDKAFLGLFISLAKILYKEDICIPWVSLIWLVRLIGSVCHNFIACLEAEHFEVHEKVVEDKQVAVYNPDHLVKPCLASSPARRTVYSRPSDSLTAPFLLFIAIQLAYRETWR